MKLKMIRGIVFFIEVIILVIIKDKWSDYIIKFISFFSLHSYSRRLHISHKAICKGYKTKPRSLVVHI